jgi:DNA-binding response OmpR family regulator
MKKIIIVDDDPGIQDSATLIFGKTDYEVTVCPNGNLILAGEFEVPDIFIIDKQLPGIDGLELCRYLKNQEKTKGIPVIMMSATPALGEVSRSAGAQDFIEKPYSVKQLRGLVIKLTS